jgi:hypothetical protein
VASSGPSVMRRGAPFIEMNRKELTTALGLFNYALSYRAAADKLQICKVRATHPHAPVPFAYYHSLELYLKAFLRAHGLSAAA